MFKDISIEEAKKMIEENNIFVLDVRTPAEFNSSHIEGAKLIPISNAFGSKMNSEMLLESKINEIPKNQTACGHPTLKDGVCFGPHAWFVGLEIFNYSLTRFY